MNKSFCISLSCDKSLLFAVLMIFNDNTINQKKLKQETRNKTKDSHTHTEIKKTQIPASVNELKLTPSKPSSQSLSAYFVIFEHARNFTASPTNAIQTAMRAWRIIDAMKMLVLRTKTIIKYSIKYYNRAFISRRIQ